MKRPQGNLENTSVLFHRELKIFCAFMSSETNILEEMKIKNANI